MAETTRDASLERPHIKGEDSSSETEYGSPKSRIITAAERRAVRKLDYSIIPIMTMFYLLSFLVILFANLLNKYTDSHEFRIVLILVRISCVD